MQEKSTLARPYASAVFEQAREDNAFAAWSDLLAFLEAAVAEPGLASVIADPRVESARLQELVLSICEGRLTEHGANFVRVLVENRRLALVPEIRRLFEAQRREHEGEAEVEVIAAYELEPRHEELIAKALSKRFGRRVDINVSIDQALIGGAVIRAGDLVIDLSLRGRLEQLARTLT